jgi:hypothetical protein
MKYFLPLSFVFALSLSLSIVAEPFVLSSQDINQGEMMSKKHEYKGFGCSGDNLSPQLQWKNVPQGTKSFALTAYDPDAPTGSGWWHWQVINIPVNTEQLARGAGNIDSKRLPTGALQIESDYGSASYGGACPPEGHGQHRYRFTIHALSVERIDLPQTASGALTGYMINANSIASSTVEALYKR